MLFCARSNCEREHYQYCRDTAGLSTSGLEPATVGVGRDRTAVGWWVWMVVRFVCVIRVPVCPVCVPAPPGVFFP